MESSAGKRQSRISDMSFGGCYIESVTNFRKGETLSFELEGTSGDVLRFSGNVAYVLEGFGFGLTFTDLTSDHHAFLNRTLASECPPIADAETDLLEVW